MRTPSLSKLEIEKLYNPEQINRIRTIASKIIKLSGYSMDKAHALINESLQSRNTSLYRDYLSIIKYFGDEDHEKAISLDLIKHFPKLSPLTSEYTWDQLVAIALGQDPIFNQVAWQKQMGKLYYYVKEMESTISGSHEENYWKTTDLRFLYSDYQIKRIRDTADSIIKENDLKIDGLAEKINQNPVLEPFNAATLRNLKLFGEKSKYSSIKNLPKLVDLHWVSSVYSEEDLKLIALGQTPKMLIEQEQEDFLRYQRILETMQQLTNNISTYLLKSSWINHINQPSFNNLNEYLKFIFKNEALDWDTGISTLIEHCPSQKQEIVKVCKGRKKDVSNNTLASLRWGIHLLSKEWLSLDGLATLINNN